MTQAEAYQKLASLVKDPNLLKHHLACEAIMRDLCVKLVPNVNVQTIEKWGIVGLLHDADYELTRNSPENHTKMLEEKIGKDLDADVMYAIKAHNYKHTGATPKSLMDWSIYTCDELSGLIIASALIHPDKKLASLSVDFVLKRFNDNSFAKGANRNQIKECESKLNIKLNDFIQISLTAMQKISPKLGL